MRGEVRSFPWRALASRNVGLGFSDEGQAVKPNGSLHLTGTPLVHNLNETIYLIDADSEKSTSTLYHPNGHPNPVKFLCTKSSPSRQPNLGSPKK